MIDIVATLENERSRLEEELLADPRYVKIRRINDLLLAYSKDARSNGHSDERPLVARKAPPRTRRKRNASKMSSIKTAVHEFLSTAGTAHRREILASVTRAGIMGQETDPMASLAAYLSRWRDEFASDGNGNYFLVKSA